MNDDGKEVLNLHTDFSLGRIIVYRANATEPSEFLDALGPVRIPKGSSVFLDLSQAVCDDLFRMRLIPDRLLTNGLSIRRKSLEGANFQAFHEIKDLKVLNVRSCVLKSEQLRQLNGLTSLEHLNLSDTEIVPKHFSWIVQFPKLRGLDLSGTGVDSACIEFLAGLQQLEYLRLQRTRLSTRDIQAIWKFKCVKDLILEGCRLGDDALEGVGTCQSLTSLTVSHSNISDTGVEAMSREFRARPKQLNSLRLRDSRITDRSLVYLCSFTGLRMLDIFGTQVTRGGVAFIQQSLPNCQIWVEETKF